MSEIAKLIDAQCQVEDAEIIGIAALDDALETDLAVLLDDKYLEKASTSRAKYIVSSHKDIPGKHILYHPAPRKILPILLKAFFKKQDPSPGVSSQASVAEKASLGRNVFIDDFVKIAADVVIGDSVKLYSGVNVGSGAKIGSGTVVHANVTIYENVQIGQDCILYSGCRIGVDGFGHVQRPDKTYEKVPQLGTVIIGDRVEIGANTCIDRGTLGNTIVGSGTKIDNLTHLAHNVVLGENCALTGLIALAGSTTVGDNVQFGGQCGATGHLHIGSNSVVMARSVVTKDIPNGSVISGFPARDHKLEMKAKAKWKKMTGGQG